MANNRDLINAFDDCIERLDSGEHIDDVLKDYPDAADYLRDLLMIGERVSQIHEEDDETTQAQSRGRDRLQQALQDQPKEKAKRGSSSRRPRWYLATVAAASFVLLIGAGLFASAVTTSSFSGLDMTKTMIAEANTTTEALIYATQTQAQAFSAATQQTTFIPTMTVGIPVDSFEMTSTAIIGQLTSTAEPQVDPFSLSATSIINDITATAVIIPAMPTLSAIEVSQLTADPLSEVFLQTPSPEGGLSAVEMAQLTATALAELFFESTPAPVGTRSGGTTTTTGGGMPDTGGGGSSTGSGGSVASAATSTVSFGGGGVDGDGEPTSPTESSGVEGGIKTTSMPFLSPTPVPSSTVTTTPAPSLIAGTSVAAEVLLTPTAEPIAMTPLPALIPLSAGEINDNADWDRYLLYRQEFLARNIPVYDLDVTGRQIITVVDNNDQPVLGARVRIFANGEVVAETVTYATGQTMFLPNINAATRDVSDFFVTIEKNGVSEQFTFDRQQLPEWTTVKLPLTINRDAVELDVLFLIDTTGSMADEISQLQNNILHISTQIDELAVDARYGLVAYRDFEDAYITQPSRFVADVNEFQIVLNQLVADGGGDTPEALNTALNTTVTTMEWRGADTIKLVFLVADAPPHINHVQETARYDESIQTALAQAIKIHPIASSGLDAQGEYIFRQIAQVTMGDFLFLTYGSQDVTDAIGDVRPDLNVGEPESTDPENGYTVDRLADVVLQLIQDEINIYRGILPIP